LFEYKGTAAVIPHLGPFPWRKGRGGKDRAVLALGGIRRL